MNKKMLQIDEQMAMELPSRDLMLVTVVITDVLNNLSVAIDVRNVDIAAQICAAIVAENVTCDIDQ